MIAMNGSRWSWTVIGLIASALVLHGIINPIGLSHTDVEAGEMNYSLSFTSAANRFSTSATETTGTATTTAGTAISFTYNKLTQATSTWETVAPGGYFFNTTPINGLKTISFVFGNAYGISLSYGWNNPSTGAVDYRFTGTVLNSTTSTYAFQDERPDCFKIENTSGTQTASITSFTLAYSCSSTPDPYYAGDTTGFVFVSLGASYEVHDYTGSATVIVIPSSYSGLPITAIGVEAFIECQSPTSITIPSSVTSIGDYAFNNCRSLKSISISNGVTTIGTQAFYNCNKLISITIPGSVTSIGDGVFNYCTSLTSITISSGLISIGSLAFYNCFFLTSIVIPTSVTSIGAEAFAYCSALTYIKIPNSVTLIGNKAFNQCSSATIYCQVLEINKPAGWSATWNYSNCPVNWGVA